VPRKIRRRPLKIRRRSRVSPRSSQTSKAPTQPSRRLLGSPRHRHSREECVVVANDTPLRRAAHDSRHVDWSTGPGRECVDRWQAFLALARYDVESPFDPDEWRHVAGLIDAMKFWLAAVNLEQDA
jgi:hypothetical protein